ncbi:hypothetical protein NUW58_g5489 [Xylaria curta]|uniref:Uncharacterized protein n=1 Tax=Xylaria curta TaxID=42375 RepID=A0ACC1P2T9_9PEZI|nr:hypothetical protein NUW58_g5489 [Xylaria curta]
MKLAEYLFQRLHELGIESIHGVPGDYNLELLDYVEPAGLLWVGNTNELNAAYAADGYARIKGIGALITTFGVGELSAVNAIAGAYTERAPVVHIVGIPARESHEKRLLIHHTFNDGEYRRFAEIHSRITVAQARLWDIRTTQQQIDDILLRCLLHSRPVYIEIPTDLVALTIIPDDGMKPLEIPKAVYDPSWESVLDQITVRIHSAKQPIIIVDGETRPMGIIQGVQKLLEITRWPVWTTPFGKGLLDETAPNFHGIYQGTFAQTEVNEFFNRADLILCFGPHWSSRPDVSIVFTDEAVEFNNKKHRNIPAAYIVSHLVHSLNLSPAQQYEPYPSLPHDFKLPVPDPSDNQPLVQDRLWPVLANILRPGDIILGETGTAGYGVRAMPLPKHTRVFTPVTWLSIGYMLPASQGAALAQRELIRSHKYFGLSSGRAILIIGDGSFQMTVQELSTIIRHNLNIMVILINNDGYTIERCIHGRRQKYNDIARWRYLQAPSFFGADPDTYVGSVKTFGELGSILTDNRFIDGSGLRMVELFVGREDAPTGPLLHYLQIQKEGESAGDNV